MNMRIENTYIRKAAKYVGMALTALLLVCMLLGAWAGYIDPAVWAVPAMLCLVFPVLWLLSLGAGALWLWLSRNKAYAAACGVALLASLPTLLAVSPLRFPEGLRRVRQSLSCSLTTWRISRTWSGARLKARAPSPI